MVSSQKRTGSAPEAEAALIEGLGEEKVPERRNGNIPWHEIEHRDTNGLSPMSNVLLWVLLKLSVLAHPGLGCLAAVTTANFPADVILLNFPGPVPAP